MPASLTAAKATPLTEPPLSLHHRIRLVRRPLAAVESTSFSENAFDFLLCSYPSLHLISWPIWQSNPYWPPFGRNVRAWNTGSCPNRMWYYATRLQCQWPVLLPLQTLPTNQGAPRMGTQCLPRPWRAATTEKEKRKKAPTISIYLIVVTKHQRLQMRRRLSRREADRGRRLAKVAVIERSQIEYHPACQNGCQELLKSMFFFQTSKVKTFWGGRGTLTRLKDQNIGATITIAWDGVRSFFREMRKRRTGNVYIMMIFVMHRAIK